jgi:predicted outer membrane protein
MKKLLMLGTAIAGGLLLKRVLDAQREAPATLTRRPRSLPPAEPVFGLVRVGGADESLEILARFDQLQVDAALVALERDLDDATLGMAERLRKEHGDRLEETRARAEERNTDAAGFGSVTAFDTHCCERLEELRGLPDAAFAEAYRERVADEHAAMVALIEDTLLPEADDPTVRELLRRHRTHLARHLAEVRKLH